MLAASSEFGEQMQSLFVLMAGISLPLLTRLTQAFSWDFISKNNNMLQDMYFPLFQVEEICSFLGTL